MATKVKDTPVLYGEDARRFEENMRKAEQNPVSDEEYQRIRAAGKRVRVFNSMAEYERYRADQAGR
jgi:hypothetical protein